MPHVTDLEARLIRLILGNEFNDSAAANVDVWAFSVFDAGWDSKQQFAGVISSAAAKGLIKAYNNGGGNTLRVTDAGAAALASNPRHA